MLLRKNWGKGIATEITQALLEHATKTLGLKRILAFTDTSNLASIRVLEKSGFEKSTLQKNEVGPKDAYTFVFRTNLSSMP